MKHEKQIFLLGSVFYLGDFIWSFAKIVKIKKIYC